MNKIIIELHEEDRKRLDTLIRSIDDTVRVLRPEKETPALDADAINSVGAPIAAEALSCVAASAETRSELEGQVSLFDEPTPVAEPAPEVNPISLAAFQRAVTEAVAKGPDAKKAAKEIINKYAASVSAVPEDKRAEVMAELANI